MLQPLIFMYFSSVQMMVLLMYSYDREEGKQDINSADNEIVFGKIKTKSIELLRYKKGENREEV
jgi:hypothetical protein